MIEGGVALGKVRPLSPDAREPIDRCGALRHISHQARGSGMKGVFVVGAGPAGMFAARQIALAGFEVFIFNRDIKPGGLAEYGIYPLKDKMKFGLRKQFAKVLEMPNVHYFGNVKVGDHYDLTIADLEAMHPGAIVFTCGAQGTKKLGLPGEDVKGVYAAKDFVYHYNQLPPYASQDFSTGKRIAVVGMGNVAIDIARWLLLDSPDRRTEEVIIIARRGPLEIKFDKKEIEYVDRHISREGLIAELARVKDRCEKAGQDVSPEKVFEQFFKRLNDPDFTSVPPQLSFRFLSSPGAMIADAEGRIAAVEVAENDLALRADGSTAARPNGQTAMIPVDTLIFAIGDKHDPEIGLPMGRDGYATRPNAERPDEPVFQVWDPVALCELPGRFVAGWARMASTGLVGIARHDGELGANQAIEYVKTAPDTGTMSEPEIEAHLRASGLRIVTKQDLTMLTLAEEREAEVQSTGAYRFSNNDAMLAAIAREREQLASTTL
jgi:ferredoxin/flavodoxin---NADP+ reductase